MLTEEVVDHNPVTGVKLQGIKRKMLYTILSPVEMHTIYHDYKTGTLGREKNKAVIGLLVYQGLRTEELKRLQAGDIKLKEGEIIVPGSKKSNGRTLQLESSQVLDLYHYLHSTRPNILGQTGEQTQKLFVSVKGESSLRVDTFMKQLRGQCEQSGIKLQTTNQIRASVIVKWLKQYNLREVQYRAGHRFISSTEKYLQNEIEGLQEEINRYHPLG